MKMSYVFLAFLFVSLLSCTNDDQQQAETTTNTTTNTTTATNGERAANQERIVNTINDKTPIKGTIGEPISSQSMQVIKAIANNLWYMNAYIWGSKPEQERKALFNENKGRWFDFKLDGTFTTGKWGDTLGKGTWKYDPQIPGVYLNHDERRDEEYEIKMSSDEQIMIWIGTKTFKEGGAQARLVNQMELPVPE